MSDRTPCIVLGGTGYVAGELLRLIAGHPQLELRAVLSDSQPGERVDTAFGHLRTAYPELQFSDIDRIEALLCRLPRCALFSAAPHGVAAGLIDRLLSASERCGNEVSCVDISADFRYADVAAYEAVYQHAHGAPGRILEFTCAVPEHLQAAPTKHIAHPGCFATATLLAAVPLLALNVVEPDVFVAGVTGSTGSGRKPTEGTHHPQRHSDLYSYGALNHRHTPEIAACARAASGVAANFNFVPHSGPFARGIHITLQAPLKQPMSSAQVVQALKSYYGAARFVNVLDQAPRMKDVVASNYAHLGASTNGRSVAVTCVIDNLNKGAAGGAMQWMNRLIGCAESAGLTAPAPGWT